MTEFLGSLKMITNGSVLLYILKGVGFTVVIAFIAVVLGIIIGTILALVRNYCTKGFLNVFRYIAIAYVEVFRNTPLMLWMFIGLVFFPSIEFPAGFAKFLELSRTEVAVLFKAIAALVLFTSSVIAEIIRGGLNSIPKGQFEAAYSQGFNFAQTLMYIVLPQTFKNIVPTLLSQAYGKDIPAYSDCTALYGIVHTECIRCICALRTGLRNLFRNQFYPFLYCKKYAEAQKAESYRCGGIIV